MPNARRLLIIAGAPVAVFIAVMLINGLTETHPFLFRAPADASHAFTWDTTPEIVRRGNCEAGADDNDSTPGLRAEWRPQPGRYILTILSHDGPSRWRRTHGRLWLHDPRKPPQAESGSSGPAAEYLLYGATDVDLARVFAPGTLVTALTPLPASTDPSTPGVVVVRDASSTHIVMIMGRGALPPLSGGEWRAPIVVLRLNGGIGDGFWGTWRGGDSTTNDSGAFCAGWIEV